MNVPGFLASDSERMVYLDLLRQAVQSRELSVAGYCLMSTRKGTWNV